MITIAVLNQKGGVGKTTTVVNVAAALSGAGSRVVVLDFDPQAHLTIHLGLEPQSVQFGSYQVLIKSAKFENQILLMRPNLWLLPANINLVGAESELVSVVARETILREAIQSSGDKFDYCFIDCGPSLGLLTLNALTAAEYVLIPLQPHFLALRGLGKLLQTVELVNKRINPNLKVKWILLCMFDGRASLPNEVKADIEEFLQKARGDNCAWAQAEILPVHIRRNIKLAKAPSYGQTIFEYEQNCHGAQDYKKVAELIHAQFHRPKTEDIPEPAAAEIQEQAPVISTLSPQADSQVTDEPGKETKETVDSEEKQEKSVESSTSLPQTDTQMSTELSKRPADTEEEQEEPAESSALTQQSDTQISTEPSKQSAKTEEKHEEAAEPSVRLPKPDSQELPEPENQAGETEKKQVKPPIEIKSIPPQKEQEDIDSSDSETQSSESAQTTTDKPDSD